MTKNILITGAQGYKGSVLVGKLLESGHTVTAVDIGWFGNYLPDHGNLSVLTRDVRDIDSLPVDGVDTIIHLASIANDPCGDLNPKLTWEVSGLATMRLADKARRVGVKQFIYASSGSVYGVSDEPEVTEDLWLDPISEYNKTKMVSERVLLSYREDMAVQIVRPATVCGISPRMRFDVSVNLLTIAGLEKGIITVFGGNQVRPNVHIEDICDIYLHLLNNPSLVGIYNAGFENLSIMEIARMASRRTGAEIEVKASNDPRSYRVNSDKLLATGFAPKKSVQHAINEICDSFEAGRIKSEENFYNLTWMQKMGFTDA